MNLLLHISDERYALLLKQGHAIQGYTLAPEQERTLPAGDTTFHLLSGDRGFCDLCGAEFDSIAVSTPAELETLKHRLRADAVH